MSGTMRSASARGEVPAALASTMAALVARSPCEGSLVGSSMIPSTLASSGKDPPVEPCKNVHGSSGEVLFAHDLIGKPVPTFPDHALPRD